MPPNPNPPQPPTAHSQPAGHSRPPHADRPAPRPATPPTKPAHPARRPAQGPPPPKPKQLPEAPPSEPAGAPEPTPLEDTPIFQLRQPVKVHSAILDETIYLVANDILAEPLRQQGHLAYTSREIVHLQAALALFTPDQRAARLRQIHEAKRNFGGAVIDYVRAPAPDGPTSTACPLKA